MKREPNGIFVCFAGHQQINQGHIPPHLQGYHPRPSVPPHSVMVSQAQPSSTSAGTSELRAVLSQPSKLAQQEQQLIQQRLQQQQQLAQQQQREREAREREAVAREREAVAREREAREREAVAREREAREREAVAREREARERETREREAVAREREAREREQHLGPRTPLQERQSPGAPIMSAVHRLPFPIQEAVRPSKHAEPKVSPSALEARASHVQPPTDYHLPKDVRDSRPGSAFNPPDGRLPTHPADARAPGMPHPERIGVPPHLYPGDVRFPHPGIYPSGALSLGVGPRMGMDPRMMFPPGSAEHLQYLQQMAFADKQMQNLIAQQHGMQHSPHELPLPDRVGSRPPSRPTSAQPSPGVTPSPHPQHSPGALQPHQPHPGMVPAPPAQGRPSIPGGPVIMGTGHEAPLPGPSDPLFMLLQVSCSICGYYHLILRFMTNRKGILTHEYYLLF